MVVNPESSGHKSVTDNNLISIREAAKGFLISMRVANNSQRYLETLEGTLALFAVFAEEQGWPAIADVTAGRIEEYLGYVQTRPRWFGQRDSTLRSPSQSYVASQHTRIKRFFNWLVDRGHVPDNPLRQVPKPKVEERVILTVSEDQVLALLRLLEADKARTKGERFRAIRDRALVYLLWDTPGRRSELATLTEDAVDLDVGAILVMGKGRKERWMPIGASVHQALWDYLRAKEQMRFKGPALWVSEIGKPMLATWMYLMLKRRGARAGIPNLHPHRFRHSFAMNALEGEMPERLLRLYGGWKKIPDNYFRTLGAKHINQYHQGFSPADRLGQMNGSHQGRKEKGGKARGRL